MNNDNLYHIPVLLQESIAGLAIKPDGVYVDATLGGGGHFRVIASKLDKKGVVIGVDRDAEAIAWNREHMVDTGATCIFSQCMFSQFDSVCTAHGILHIDGILLDLGVSGRQIGNSQRGFSYMQSSPLDMRMDPSQGPTARNIIEEASVSELTRILAEYGEVRNAQRMAETIKEYMTLNPMTTSDDLKKCLYSEYGPNMAIQVLAKVFQAFRIAINRELDELSVCLHKAEERLANGGRLVVISYHSLEDRIVKNFIRDRLYTKSSSAGTKTFFRRITKKPLCAASEEIAVNRSARSAKLRIAEKTA